MLPAAWSTALDRIPESWTMTAAQCLARRGAGRSRRHGARRQPNRSSARGRDSLARPVRYSGPYRDGDSSLERRRRIAGHPRGVARYLTPGVRTRIRDMGAGYVVPTGNIRITAERPALFVADRGAASDPWRVPARPPPAYAATRARIARALADFSPPYPQSQNSPRRQERRPGPHPGRRTPRARRSLLTRTAYGPVSDVR